MSVGLIRISTPPASTTTIINKFNGCCKGYLTTLPVTSPCNFPNAIIEPVKVTPPIRRLRTIAIPVSIGRLKGKPISVG